MGRTEGMSRVIRVLEGSGFGATGFFICFGGNGKEEERKGVYDNRRGFFDKRRGLNELFFRWKKKI